MPIKGISEVRRLRRLGRVRLGEKRESKGGKMYPAALDHFNFKDAPELLAIYGDKCKEIDVMLPNERADAFFPQARKAYRKSGLFCCGDGELACRVNVGISDGKQNVSQVPAGQPIDPVGFKFIKDQGLDCKVGEMFELPCPGEDCPFTLNKFCKPIGRFLFIAPKAPRVGCYEISTTSYNSIVELNSSIDTIRGIAGRISMIPLKLKLVPKETTVPGQTIKKTIYHLVLEYCGTFDQLSQFRGVKEIPMDQLPTRAELEHHIPDDLAPHGGEALEAEVGSAGAQAAAPEPESEPAQQEEAPPEEMAPSGDMDELHQSELVDKAPENAKPAAPSVKPPPPALPLNPPVQPKPAAPPVAKKPSRSLFR